MTPARLFRILSVAAAVPLFLYLALFFHNNMVLATYPFSIEWGEGIVVDLARKITTPAAVYKPLDDYPYVVGIYPPVYLFLVNLCGRLFENHYLGARLVAFLSVLGCAALILLILLRETRSWSVSLIAALTYTSLSFVYDFAAMARVDSTASFFSLLGLYMLYRRRPYWGAFFFVTAIYTKQSMVVTPAACLAWLAVTEKRKAVGPIVLFLALLAGLGAALQRATAGQFLVHVVLYTKHAYHAEQLLLFLRKALAETWVLLAFALFYIASEFGSRSRLGLFPVYWIAACCTLLFTGKAGSSFLYLVEYGGACCLLFGLGLSKIREYASGFRPPLGFAATAAVFALIGVQIYGSRDTCFYVKGFDDPSSMRRLQEERRCVEMVRAEEGPVLAEDVGLLISAEKEVLFHPFASAELSRLGLWDEGRFVEDIRSGKYSLVVLESLRPVGRVPAGVRTTQFTHERFSDGMLDAVFGNYRPASVTSAGWVFRRKGGKP